MADTIPGGRYQVGENRFVNANGEEVKAPSAAENRAAKAEADAQRRQEQELQDLRALVERMGAALPADQLAALQAEQAEAAKAAEPDSKAKRGRSADKDKE